MRTFYRIVRTVLVVLLVLPLVVPTLLYILLSLPAFQNKVGRIAEVELTKLLGTKVDIGEVSFAPFNRVTLRNVTVLDNSGDTALHVGHLGAGISFGESLWNKKPVITYAELFDLKVSLSRDSVGAPLNIQPIIDRFKKKEDNGPSKFDLAVNMVVIRHSAFSYDVRSAMRADSGRFDVNHILVHDLRADLRAPLISDSIIEVDLKRLGAAERSGLTVTDFSAYLRLDKKKSFINDLTLTLPASNLSFASIELPSILAGKPDLGNLNTHLATLPDTYVSPSDLSPFLPVLRDFTTPVDIEIDVNGRADSLNVDRLSVALRDKDTYISANGRVLGLGGDMSALALDLERLSVNINVPEAINLLSTPGAPGHELVPALRRFEPLGEVNILGSVAGARNKLDFNGSVLSDCGNFDLDCGISREGNNGPLKIDGMVATNGFDPSHLLGRKEIPLTDVTLEGRADLMIGHRGAIDGNAELTVSSLSYKDMHFRDISATALFAGHHVDFSLSSDSPDLDFSLHGGHDLSGEHPATEIFADFRSIALASFTSSGSRLSGATVSGALDSSLEGRNLDDITGWVRFRNLSLGFNDDKMQDIVLATLDVEAEREDSLRRISVTSPVADINLSGNYTFKGLVDDINSLVADLFPALHTHSPLGEADCLSSLAQMEVTVHPDTIFSRFFHLPVEVIYPVTLRGATDPTTRSLSVKLDAPYLKNKNKLVEETSLSLLVNGLNHKYMLEGGTTLPTKNGPMRLEIGSSGGNDSLRTGVNWKVIREKDFHGDLDFTTALSRLPGGALETRIKFHPTQLVFNDSAWNVFPGAVNITPGKISVIGFGGGRDGQSLNIDGVASADSIDRIVVALDHIDLDYIFETLAISDAVNFGGRATGRLFGEALLSKLPVLYTPRLSVDGLSYNHCVMGDGVITSFWDTSTKDIVINADIRQANGKSAEVRGFINPLTESLDFRFKADESPVGFMLPFMSAFTSAISGTVSGNAHLFGTFKDLDMEGDIYAENFGLKLDFTNTVYTVTDSVHISPGNIEFNDVILTDCNGKNARLTGRVGHEQFHNPTFTFEIRDASELLVYDVGEHDTEDPWYGRIYGRGGATVRGVPGLINIDVNMVTEPGSTFTFVLDDREQSTEYNFITFRDKNRHIADSLAALDPTPLIVKNLRDMIKKQEDGPPTEYKMEFNVDVTPAATLYLIMDPIGGDKITAHGSGHLRMLYDSEGELGMWGKYTLNRGSYNFTLQDIVVKDFTIREGSYIEFRGDPYAAQLDITAVYTTNANLSDLDESFLDDPELNRTNVRVNALLTAKGDMRQPEIGFDLEFPSLTADTYRKVRSIVSTEEMMDRQIIYLLALNRFYTPDYMTATHGNGLVSVASSTLSSRLGSMLGQLSDNWSIAPAIRSDRGDFSDVEVDVALSSHLLDNRLLFNGNLGYRDKSLNNNSFIGDFDIRYLLNRAGTYQLKAYNRYNDQNYYLKSALTTQGVGLVFKREFDTINPFGWLKRIRKNKDNEKVNVKPAEKSDSISSVAP